MRQGASEHRSDASELRSEPGAKWVPKPEAARILAEQHGRDVPYSDKWLRELEKRGEIETRREGGRVFVKVRVNPELTSELDSELHTKGSELTSELIQQIRTQHDFLRGQLERTQDALQKSNEDIRKKDEDLAYTRRQLDAVTSFLIASLVQPERLPKSSEAGSELLLDVEPSASAESYQEAVEKPHLDPERTSEPSYEVVTKSTELRPAVIRGGKRPGRMRLAWRVLTGQIELPA